MSTNNQYFQIGLIKYLAIIFLVLFSACTPTNTIVVPTLPNTNLSVSPVHTPTIDPSPVPSLTFQPSTPTLTLIPSTPTPSRQICSPLEGFTLDEIPGIVTNPFKPPPEPGRDDMHHGVDLSFWSHGNLTSMRGLPVHSVLPGIVASDLPNRTPYGNAIIIETPLEEVPDSWLPIILVPTQAPTQTYHTNLTCPPYSQPPVWDFSKRSLYLLYAHLNTPPIPKVGDSVMCGQLIGEVGTTGLSSNEHLHFETRIGPSGARFSSMDHYDNAATAEEMANYCTWRVSNIFQLMDPMKLLSVKP